MHENFIMMLLAALKSHHFCLFFCKFTRQPYCRREATMALVFFHSIFKDRTDDVV